MKGLRIFFFLTMFFNSLFFSCSVNQKDEAGIILDIPTLINKLPSEIVNLLGEPDTIYYDQVLNKKFLVHRYVKHDIEIQYLKGKANDIIVNDPLSIEFKAESLSYFGIKPAIPTVFRENEMIKWKNYSGLKTINFYKVKKDNFGNIISFKIYFKA